MVKNRFSTPRPSTSSGKLPYTLTNDYLFRAVFQSKPKALEGLCRSVLGLSPEDRISVSLRNPIELGTQIDNKEFILDIAVIINDNIFLNLEMQVYQDPFWTDRSLSYACRSFDNLNRGESYLQVLPSIHVGFLNYTLFPEYPEFFATYQMANVSNPATPYIYSDKLRISVVNLTQIENATESDKATGVNLWARIFNATTWEEIEMLAQDNESLQEAVSGVRQLTEDEKIRQQCQAREDFAYWERIRNHRLMEQDEEIQKKDAILLEQDATIREKDAKILEKDAAIQEKDAAIQEKDAAIQEKDAKIAELEAKLAALNS